MPIIEDALGMLLGGAIGAGTGQLSAQQQLSNQKELIDKQTEQQKELGKYNQDLAMQMWENTNYSAQRAEMEKAGLNVGLMYKGAGQGGTTQGGSAGNTVSTSGAPQHNAGTGALLGMQAAINKQMQEAQIENIEANTRKTEVETAKTAGVDTQQVQANITNIAQQTTNAALQNQIMQWDTKMKEIQTDIADRSRWDVIRTINQSAEKLIQEVQSAEATAFKDQATKDTLVTQIKNQAIEQQLRISAQKQNLQVNEQSMQKVAQEIQLMHQEKEINWSRLNQQERETYVKEQILKNDTLRTEFNTSDPQKLKQWIGIITDMIPFMPR